MMVSGLCFESFDETILMKNVYQDLTVCGLQFNRETNCGNGMETISEVVCSLQYAYKLYIYRLSIIRTLQGCMLTFYIMSA